jgi:hypothetical protein
MCPVTCAFAFACNVVVSRLCAVVHGTPTGPQRAQRRPRNSGNGLPLPSGLSRVRIKAVGKSHRRGDRVSDDGRIMRDVGWVDLARGAVQLDRSRTSDRSSVSMGLTAGCPRSGTSPSLAE